MRVLLTVMGMGPRHSYIDVDDRHVTVRMGWAFKATVGRENIVGATASRRRTISIGVHGWRGRWLVNGSGKNIVVIDIEPRARGRVLGVPVRLRQIMVSAVDPGALVAAIGDRTSISPN